MFDHPLHKDAATKWLISLKQGNKSAADHSIDFRILAKEESWDELALRGIYINSLSENIKDQLAS